MEREKVCKDCFKDELIRLINKADEQAEKSYFQPEVLLYKLIDSIRNEKRVSH